MVRCRNWKVFHSRDCFFMKKFIVFLTQPPQLTCVVVTHRKQINHFLNTSFTSRPHMPELHSFSLHVSVRERKRQHSPTSIWSHKYKMSLELKHSCTARCLIVSITHFCKYLLIFRSSYSFKPSSKLSYSYFSLLLSSPLSLYLSLFVLKIWNILFWHCFEDDSPHSLGECINMSFTTSKHAVCCVFCAC